MYFLSVYLCSVIFWQPAVFWSVLVPYLRTHSILKWTSVKSCKYYSHTYCCFCNNLYFEPGHAGVRGNEIANELARGVSGLGFLGPEPVRGVSKQDIQRRISRWLVNQHWIRWRSLGDTQRQAQELTSGPCLGAKARFCPLTGHNPGLLLAFSLDIIPLGDIFA